MSAVQAVTDYQLRLMKGLYRSRRFVSIPALVHMTEGGGRFKEMREALEVLTDDGLCVKQRGGGSSSARFMLTTRGIAVLLNNGKLPEGGTDV
jgi:hypothetical protein